MMVQIPPCMPQLMVKHKVNTALLAHKMFVRCGAKWQEDTNMIAR